MIVSFLASKLLYLKIERGAAFFFFQLKLSKLGERKLGGRQQRRRVLKLGAGWGRCCASRISLNRGAIKDVTDANCNTRAINPFSAEHAQSPHAPYLLSPVREALRKTWKVSISFHTFAERGGGVCREKGKWLFQKAP